ncbi:MAG: Rrf2 family transcriptional regulator [Devosia sp.]|uniref:Rrf2 family transcriptional regulator n=1 Tax=Devosia sp. TaxID=1871048 RepID=UPI00260F10BB|nr:Rrf2 family transcriptional regulator [Devosia sp.]MDB5585616.1 Rrf2 family transcriptional regulator [Devosia sp.]
MKRSARLSVALHALVHLVDKPEAVTSTILSECLMTNPVVVRRVMGELREAGIVSSAKGHDGGWRLTRPPGEVSLQDVHAALGETLLLRAESDPGDTACTIVRTVDRVMTDFLADAEALLAARLKRISLGDLARNSAHDHKTISGV